MDAWMFSGVMLASRSSSLRGLGDKGSESCGLTKLREAGQVSGKVGECSRLSAGTFPGGVSTRQTSQHLDQANKDGPRSDAAR
jgi:hypothetical protein